MTQQLTFSVDDSILLSMKRDKDDFLKDMLFYAALSLYRKNRLSLGKAAELTGMDRLDFIDKLKQEGEIIFHYDEKYLEEINSGVSQFLSKFPE
ncbi:MAG: UPF0175 family protein [Leptospiraceae bacterium]|nr:UPF0175 family protein [Leptospiraceae bacterium]